MGVSAPMRVAALTIIGLLVTGLAWRGWGLYQADQRAALAASFAEVESVQQAKAPVTTAGEEEPTAAAACPPAPEKPALLVHVEGAVQHPGVYTLPEGSRVHEAIAAAGGALQDGVPGALNLAALLTDGTKLYIYTNEELHAAAEASAPASREVSYVPVRETIGQSQAMTSHAAGPVIVSINSASTAELERVPGIGPSTARAISEYRSQHGPFPAVEDLTKVSGIGPKTLEKLRPYLKL